jgi:hypothetical protein
MAACGNDTSEDGHEHKEEEHGESHEGHSVKKVGMKAIAKEA